VVNEGEGRAGALRRKESRVEDEDVEARRAFFSGRSEDMAILVLAKST